MGRRWLFGLAAVLLILMAVVVLLAAVGSTAQSGVRAYVGGEGLWSKAQKDAVLHLKRYIETGSEGDWVAYEGELQVTLGDAAARVELERPEADMSVVATGFVTGRNAPEDVAGMAMVFRTFRHVGYIDRAITIWAIGRRSSLPKTSPRYVRSSSTSCEPPGSRSPPRSTVARRSNLPRTWARSTCS